MKKYYLLSNLVFACYIAYIFCGSIFSFFLVGAQTTIVLAIVGLPFFILSIVYDHSDEKLPRYQWFQRLEENSEEELLTSYYHEYHTRFTALCTPAQRVNIAHILELTQPCKGQDEHTWAWYADLVVATAKKGH